MILWTGMELATPTSSLLVGVRKDIVSETLWKLAYPPRPTNLERLATSATVCASVRPSPARLLRQER
jgi:hypothetical protein